MGNIMSGDFGLLNGNMDNLVKAGAIPCRIDVGHVGLLVEVREDEFVLELHSDFFESEISDIRDPA